MKTLETMQPDFASEPFESAAIFPESRPNTFEWLLHRMIDRIRRSLELSEILTTTVAEVRAFLGSDRVKIYQFYADGSGEVVAEAIYNRRLPSLLGHSFPATDIPPESRELFLTARQRSVVDMQTRTIGISPLEGDAGEILGGDIRFRPVHPCHAEYLRAMGVGSSVVVPILAQEQLWGLLVAHYSVAHAVTEAELQVLQLVVDQVSVAIAQSMLLAQVRLKASQEFTLSQIADLLHTTPEIQVQIALEQAIAALQGSGGRLYLAPRSTHSTPQLFIYGDQPQMSAAARKSDSSVRPDANSHATPHLNQTRLNTVPVPPASSQSAPNDSVAPSLLIEQHPHWQAWLAMEESLNQEEQIWAIADIYRAVLPSDLAMAFLAVQVRSLVTIRLHYRQQFLGYFTIFRAAINTERIWAGRVDRNDPHQLRPRRSFETWRERKQDQPQPWTTTDIELIQAIAHHFAIALH